MKAQKIIFSCSVTACSVPATKAGWLFLRKRQNFRCRRREIYLYRTSNNRSAATVDTAVIENGRFIFEGIQETPIGATL